MQANDKCIKLICSEYAKKQRNIFVITFLAITFAVRKILKGNKCLQYNN